MARFCGLRIAKVTETYADEAEEAARAEVYFVAEFQCDASEVFERGRRTGWSVAAGVDVELFCLEFKNDGAGDARLAAGGGPDFFGEAADEVVGLGERNVD